MHGNHVDRTPQSGDKRLTCGSSLVPQDRPSTGLHPLGPNLKWLTWTCEPLRQRPKPCLGIPYLSANDGIRDVYFPAFCRCFLRLQRQLLLHRIGHILRECILIGCTGFDANFPVPCYHLEANPRALHGSSFAILTLAQSVLGFPASSNRSYRGHRQWDKRVKGVQKLTLSALCA